MKYEILMSNGKWYTAKAAKPITHNPRLYAGHLAYPETKDLINSFAKPGQWREKAKKPL